MIVVDASCLCEVLVAGPAAESIRQRLLADPDQAAPHIVDVEVFGIVRRLQMTGAIDETTAGLSIDGLRRWPGERFGHRPLLDRAWELRANVRGWDAMYVALAEILGAPLLTLDRRLANASGPQCEIEVPGPE